SLLLSSLSDRCCALVQAAIPLVLIMSNMFHCRSTNDITYLEEFFHKALPEQSTPEFRKALLLETFAGFRVAVEKNNVKEAANLLHNVAGPLFRRRGDAAVFTSPDVIEALFGAEGQGGIFKLCGPLPHPLHHLLPPPPPSSTSLIFLSLQG